MYIVVTEMHILSRGTIRKFKYFFTGCAGVHPPGVVNLNGHHANEVVHPSDINSTP